MGLRCLAKCGNRNMEIGKWTTKEVGRARCGDPQLGGYGARSGGQQQSCCGEPAAGVICVCKHRSVLCGRFPGQA